MTMKKDAKLNKYQKKYTSEKGTFQKIKKA